MTPLPDYTPRYIDIGINLSDPIFQGVYHGNRKHPDDLDAVISRARDVGCQKLIVTGSDLQSSRDALELAHRYPGTIHATIGIHPCSSAIFSSNHTAKEDAHTTPCDPVSDPSAPASGQEPCSRETSRIISELSSLLHAARGPKSDPGRGLVAFGEFGLDYDRLHYCSKDVQRHSFSAQLQLAASLDPQLPLFLHSRAAHGDFVSLLKAQFGERLQGLARGGVVHSFTGTMEEMKELVDLGLYIGVNGCSFKTVENCAVVKDIELGRIMLETDGPWCEVRPSHAGWKHLVGKNNQEIVGAPAIPSKQGSKKNQAKKESDVPAGRFKVVKKEKWVEGAMVKGRNEPCMIERVAQIVAGIKGVHVETVYEAAWKNTVHVFGLHEDAHD